MPHPSEVKANLTPFLYKIPGFAGAESQCFNAASDISLGCVPIEYLGASGKFKGRIKGIFRAAISSALRYS